MNDGTRFVSFSTSTTTCRFALAARYSLRFSSDFRSTGPLRSTVSSLNGFSAGISAGSSRISATAAAIRSTGPESRRRTSPR
jgi:hypothetical protein